jgi:hypothetical protein
MQENQWPRNPVLTFWQRKRIYSDNARRFIPHLGRGIRCRMKLVARYILRD